MCQNPTTIPHLTHPGLFLQRPLELLQALVSLLAVAGSAGSDQIGPLPKASLRCRHNVVYRQV